jgi:hypothetical protein
MQKQKLNMRLKAFAAVVVLYRSFWPFTRRDFLVTNQRFGTIFLSHVQGLDLYSGPCSLPPNPEDGKDK